MTYRFIYSTEPDRNIAASVMDSKSIIPEIKGTSGAVTKAYVDNLIILATKNGSLIYKICTFDGNMVGVLGLSVTNMGLNVEKIIQVIRPNFQSVIKSVISEITFFINSGAWQADFLV